MGMAKSILAGATAGMAAANMAAAQVPSSEVGATSQAQAVAGTLFDNVAEVLRSRYYDETFRNERLPQLLAALRPDQTTIESQRDAVQNLLAAIPASHLALLSQASFDRLMAELAGTKLPTLGFDLTRIGDDYFAVNVLEGGAAASAGINTGDEVVELDGLVPALSPLLDWRSDDAFLNDERDPPLHFLKPLKDQEVTVAARKQRGGPIMRFNIAARPDSARDAAVRSVRTIERDDRKFGYVHLWYVHLNGTAGIVGNALAGPLAQADGLLLDLRGRGGSGTELPALLEVLDKAHASRNLPVAALIDRQTRSAKDVLARELSRRPWVTLVGEPTAGAVIPASFAPVGHGAVLMFPSFTLGALTAELETKGGVAPAIAAVRPGPYANGDDPILEAGVKVLLGTRPANAAAASPQASPPIPAAAIPPAQVPEWNRLKRAMADALGGEAAIRAWRARRLEGTAEIVGVPMAGRYREIATPTGRFRTDASFGSLLVSQAFDGKSAWISNPQTGVTRPDAAATERMRTQTLFFGPLDWDSEGRSVRSVTGTVFADRPSYEVVVADAAGEISFFVDPVSRQIVGMRAPVDSPIGRVVATTAFSAHKSFSGVMIPTIIEAEAAGQRQRFVIERVIFEEPDLSEFAPPS